MTRAPLLVLLPLALAASSALAQDAVPGQKKTALHFAGDSLTRYEWTRDVPDEAGGLRDESRWRLQLRPRLELELGPFDVGVGGEGDYSKDRNDEPPAGERLAIVRDNYRSRDVRLDLAWGRLRLGPVTAQGGRFFMPIPLTEMIWDRDLRPQGGAARIDLLGRDSPNRIGVTGLYAKGSHVFEDESVMFGGSGELRFGNQAGGFLQFVGSWLEFQKLDRLDPVIRRQNTRVDGLIANEYRVVDLIGRLGSGQFTLVADYCWNTALHGGNRGLWLSAVLGSTETARARLEYTYARIDRDATVAAFNSDDFYWNTGLEAHRVELASGATRTAVRNSSVHAIAQLQRFRDSPDPQVRDRWVKRYRLEWRTSF